MTALVRRPFVVALAVGLAFGLVYPPLLRFVGLGMAVVVAPVLGEWLQRKGLLAVSVTVTGAVAVGVATFISVMDDGSPVTGKLGPASPPPPPPRVLELPTTLQMTIRYASDDHFEIVQTLTIERKTIEDAAHDVQRFRPRLRRVRVARAIRRELGGQGWKLTITSNLRDGYEQASEQAVLRNGTVPALRTNVINVRIPTSAVLFGGVDVRFPLRKGSGVRVEAPEHAIGHTFPGASSEETRRSNKHQVLTVPLDESPSEIELDVRSAPFRNDVLAPTSDLTLWAPFGWLIAAIIVLANDAFRDLLRRAFTRAIARRSGQR